MADDDSKHTPWLLGGILIILFVTGLYFWSQRQATLFGVVLDGGNNTPLGTVIVALGSEEQESLATTGTFHFQVKAGTHTVSIKHPGYQPFTTTETFKVGENKRLQIHLEALRKNEGFGGEYLITPLQGNQIEILQIPSFKRFAQIGVSGDAQAAIGLPGTHKVYVALTDKHEIAVVDFIRQRLEKKIALKPNSGPTKLALSPDGQRLFVLNGSLRTISLINTHNDTLLEQEITPSSTPLNIVTTNTGQLLIMRTNGLDRYSTDGSALLDSREIDNFWGNQIVFDAQSQALYAANSDNLTRVDSAGNVQRYPMPDSITAISLDASGEIYLAFGSRLARFQPSTQQLSLEPLATGGHGIIGMLESPDHSALWVAHHGSKDLRIFDKASGAFKDQSISFNGVPQNLSMAQLGD